MNKNKYIKIWNKNKKINIYIYIVIDVRYSKASQTLEDIFPLKTLLSISIQSNLI